MKYVLSILITLNFSSNLISQDDWRLFPSIDSSNNNITDTVKPQLDYSLNNGLINIYKDPRIDSIQKELAEEPTIMGWTVQILVSQQKEEIKNTRIKFLKAFPDHQLFDEYKTPNTYLYAGKFYDKISAYHFKNEIRVLFENTRVIKRIIELPVLPDKKVLNNELIESPDNKIEKSE